jgi:hypothetical protein
METTNSPVTLKDISEVNKALSNYWGALAYSQFVAVFSFIVGFIVTAIGTFRSAEPMVYGGFTLFFLSGISLYIAFKYDKHAADAFGLRFACHEFFTLAGERIEMVSANCVGTHVHVRFADGSEIERYPLNCLATQSGERHQSTVPDNRTSGYTANMSQIGWKTPEGKRGILRKVEIYDRQDDEFLLKFQDGQIASFPISKLVPVHLEEPTHTD